MNNKIIIHWQDWVIFVLICIISVILLYCIGAIMYLKNRNPLIKSKNVPLLCIMGISGLIHIWSVTICNNHFSWLSSIEYNNCVLWNYWFQYFFGLCPWFIAIIIRLITYGSTFSRHLTNIGYEKLRIYKWICPILFIVLPLFILLISITITKGSYFDESIQKCQSLIGFKLLLFIWIMFLGLILIISMCFINFDIMDDYDGEFKIISHIILFSIIVVFFNGFIAFLGLTKNHVYARFFATLSIALFHIFSFLRICGLPLYKSLINDKTYLHEFFVNQNKQVLNLFSIKEIKSDIPEIFDDFLDYCMDKPLKSTIINPSNLVLCYKSIQIWKNSFDKVNPYLNLNIVFKERKQKHQDIINQFLLDPTDHNDPKYIKFQDSIQDIMTGNINSKNLFLKVEEWIIEVLDSSFGSNYLQKDIYKRNLYINNAFIAENFINIKLAKSRKRQINENLIDKSIINISFINNNSTEMNDIFHKKESIQKHQLDKEEIQQLIIDNDIFHKKESIQKHQLDKEEIQQLIIDDHSMNN